MSLKMKSVCSKADGLPILDHEMSKLYVTCEQRRVILREVILRLIGAVKTKDFNQLKAIIKRHKNGTLFPWQNENWPSEVELKELVTRHILIPHYKLYRNEMAERYLVRQPQVMKLEAAFSSLVSALQEGNSKRVWKLVNKWTSY